MVIAQGKTWCVVLPSPSGVGPGFRRRIVIVQFEYVNRSHGARFALATITLPTSSYPYGPGELWLTPRVSAFKSLQDLVASSPIGLRLEFCLLSSWTLICWRSPLLRSSSCKRPALIRTSSREARRLPRQSRRTTPSPIPRRPHHLQRLPGPHQLLTIRRASKRTGF